MRKLIYLVAVSLDGCIAGKDDDTSIFPVDPPYLEHLTTHFPETLPTHVRKALGVTSPGTLFDTVVMGRKTYDPGLQLGILSPYDHLQQHVFSHSLPPSHTPGVTIEQGDPVPVVQRLKQEPSDRHIWLAGGGALASQLFDEIDQLILKVNPITVGNGTPLFQHRAQLQHFQLLNCQALASGHLILQYQKGEPLKA